MIRIHLRDYLNINTNDLKKSYLSRWCGKDWIVFGKFPSFWWGSPPCNCGFFQCTRSEL